MAERKGGFTPRSGIDAPISDGLPRRRVRRSTTAVAALLTALGTLGSTSACGFENGNDQPSNVLHFDKVSPIQLPDNEIWNRLRALHEIRSDSPSLPEVQRTAFLVKPADNSQSPFYLSSVPMEYKKANFTSSWSTGVGVTSRPASPFETPIINIADNPHPNRPDLPPTSKKVTIIKIPGTTEDIGYDAIPEGNSGDLAFDSSVYIPASKAENQEPPIIGGKVVGQSNDGNVIVAFQDNSFPNSKDQYPPTAEIGSPLLDGNGKVVGVVEGVKTGLGIPAIEHDLNVKIKKANYDNLPFGFRPTYTFINVDPLPVKATSNTRPPAQ